MIPILYEASETAFVSNGLGRLRDCITCTVTEERNGIYECDFTYPMDGAHFAEIIPGRIVLVTHDDTGDTQPFDIVSYSKPIDGIVTFHATHISYRLSKTVVAGTNIQSLADAFTMFASAEPSMPFTFNTDKTSTGYMASADGTPRSVRQYLGGIEGSVLDAYGGEYEWDKFTVTLHQSRGVARGWSIRYGVNMANYQDDTDYQGAYTSCIPYWTGSDSDGAPVIVTGNRVDSSGVSYNGRNECVPLDLTDKFESEPTSAQLETMAASIMSQKQPYLAGQTINVDFVRLQDMTEYEGYAPLLQCRLCDTLTVIFPDYTMQGQFKIVKTTWDVLEDRFTGMELGALSVSLAEALGITNALEKSTGLDQVVSQVQAIQTELTVESDTYNMPSSSGTVYAAKYGNVVTVDIYASTARTYTTGYTTICTLASQYRPDHTVVTVIGDSNTSTVGSVPLMARVQTSGSVDVYRYSGNGSSLLPRGNITFIV